MTTMSEEDICRTCGQPRSWHTEETIHPFRDAGDIAPDGLGPKREKEKPRVTVEVRNFPTDPALRIALVNKGILTLADISAADNELREAAENGRVVKVGEPQGQGSSRPDL